MELSSAGLSDMIRKHSTLKELRHYKAVTLTEIAVLREPITYDVFYEEYLFPNIPVILGQWATNDWLSRQSWVNSNDDVIFDILLQKFGDASVPVADCTKQVSYAHPKTSMKFSEFIAYLKERHIDGPSPLLLYLKDWHFQRDFPSYDAYTTPVYFQSDWLNEFWDARSDCSDDYRFLYFGPKGSWTPFHADVFRSFSWSANVSGKKKWILCPAGAEESLKDSAGNLPFNVDTDFLQKHGTKYFEVTQNAGEVLFVPSGWFHQVVNLEDTLSINHNWMNACNVDICWKYVRDSLASVEHEIAEHKQTMENWIEHCQLFLRADIGIDFADFFNLLCIVSKQRLESCWSGDVARTEPVTHVVNKSAKNQILFDLFRVSEILVEITEQPQSTEIFDVVRQRLAEDPKNLLQQLLTEIRPCLPNEVK